MPAPSNALAVPAELPMDIDTTMSRVGWSTSTLAVVMTVATLVTTIKMVATCSSCLGKRGTGATAASPGAGGGDEVLAFVRLCSNVRPLSLHPPHPPDAVPLPAPVNSFSTEGEGATALSESPSHPTISPDVRLPGMIVGPKARTHKAIRRVAAKPAPLSFL